MHTELLRRVVETCNSLGIPHMIAGSFASTFHSEPRMLAMIAAQSELLDLDYLHAGVIELGVEDSLARALEIGLS